MRGDVGGALDVLAGAGALTADFVSMAACGGRRIWEAAVRALAAQLETQGVLSCSSNNDRTMSASLPA